MIGGNKTSTVVGGGIIQLNKKNYDKLELHRGYEKNLLLLD